MGCFSTRTLDESENHIKDNNKKKDINQNNNQKQKNDIASDLNISEDLGDKKRKEEEKKLFINIHIIKKNLEAKNVNSQEIKNEMNKLFDILLKEKKEDFNKDEMIEKVLNIFIDYLKPINNQNIKNIKSVLISLYEKAKSLKDFSQDIAEFLDNICDYWKLKEEDENKIVDYLIKKLGENKNIQNVKDEISNNFKKNNFIINYEDFNQIIKKNNINLDVLELEYLLYKMKCGISLDEDLLLDSLNIKVFLDFLEKIGQNDNLNNNSFEIGSYFLKDSVLSNNVEKIGITFKNP